MYLCISKTAKILKKHKISKSHQSSFTREEKNRYQLQIFEVILSFCRYLEPFFLS
jgi:hypothetical protein